MSLVASFESAVKFVMAITLWCKSSSGEKPITPCSLSDTNHDGTTLKQPTHDLYIFIVSGKQILYAHEQAGGQSSATSHEQTTLGHAHAAPLTLNTSSSS
ncbi:hypothetical protein JOB18_027063 [Solea senegalensis]|uniref:Uncharacterized protein n=1 Tax=Solea senegalensis TaxID=28829 RepID=A0AAV6RZK6_SOLSE|nr:hypothetical protein JOB18_027063 [Solea senegalensis]